MFSVNSNNNKNNDTVFMCVFLEGNTLQLYSLCLRLSVLTFKALSVKAFNIGLFTVSTNIQRTDRKPVVTWCVVYSECTLLHLPKLTQRITGEDTKSQVYVMFIMFVKLNSWRRKSMCLSKICERASLTQLNQASSPEQFVV